MRMSTDLRPARPTESSPLNPARHRAHNAALPKRSREGLKLISDCSFKRPRSPVHNLSMSVLAFRPQPRCQQAEVAAFRRQRSGKFAAFAARQEYAVNQRRRTPRQIRPEAPDFERLAVARQIASSTFSRFCPPALSDVTFMLPSTENSAGMSAKSLLGQGKAFALAQQGAGLGARQSRRDRCAAIADRQWP